MTSTFNIPSDTYVSSSIRYTTDRLGRKLLSNTKLVEDSTLITPLTKGDFILIDGEKQWRQVKKLPSTVISKDNRSNKINNSQFYGQLELSNNLQFRSGRGLVAHTDLEEGAINNVIDSYDETYGYQSSPTIEVIPTDGMSGGADVVVDVIDGRVVGHKVNVGGSYQSQPLVYEGRRYKIHRTRVAEINSVRVSTDTQELDYGGKTTIEIPQDPDNYFRTFLFSYSEEFEYGRFKDFYLSLVPSIFFLEQYSLSNIDIGTTLEIIRPPILENFVYNLSQFDDIFEDILDSFNSLEIIDYNLRYENLSSTLNSILNHRLTSSINFLPTNFQTSIRHTTAPFLNFNYTLEQLERYNYEYTLIDNSSSYDLPLEHLEFVYRIRVSQTIERITELLNIGNVDRRTMMFPRFRDVVALVIINSEVDFQYGLLRIGDELMRYRFFSSSFGTAILSILERGYDATPIQDHQRGATVFFLENYVDRKFLYQYEFQLSIGVDRTQEFNLSLIHDYQVSYDIAHDLVIQRADNFQYKQELSKISSEINSVLTYELDMTTDVNATTIELEIITSSVAFSPLRTIDDVIDIDTVANIDTLEPKSNLRSSISRAVPGVIVYEIGPHLLYTDIESNVITTSSEIYQTDS